MTILITGAAGFIGAHLAQYYEQAGESLILLDDFSRGKQAYLHYLDVETPVTRCDLRDYHTFYKYFNGVDAVFHCAAHIGGVQYLHGDVFKEFNALHTNLLIDTNVIRACRTFMVPRIVYTSSVSVYPMTPQFTHDFHVIHEEDITPYEPDGGYGWAKLMGEEQLRLLHTHTGIARIFKVYGECDDVSDTSGQVVCTLFRRLKHHPKHLDVWGDGTAERCFLYIDDLVDALNRMYVYLEDHEDITLNIGASTSTCISDLVRLMLRVTGESPEIIYTPEKPVGVQQRIPDITRAQTILKWKPTTPLQKGLERTYEWIKTMY